MLRSLTLIGLLTFSISLFAQQKPLENLRYGDDFNQSFSVYGDVFQASNVIPLSAAIRIVNNEPISTKLRDNMAAKVRSSNRYEDWLRVGFLYEGFGKGDSTGRHGWYAGVEYSNQRQIFFPEDAFNLVFFGNAQYEDDTIFIPSLMFQDISCNRIRGGYARSIYNGDSKFSFSIGASFYQSIGQTYFRFLNTSIYTAPDGEYLDITYNTRLEQTNPGARKLSDFNGFGFGLEFGLHWEKGANKFGVTADELGLLTFKNDQEFYYGDSAIRYEGLIIDDILNPSGSPLTDISIDSLAKALGLRIGEGSYSRRLPSTLAAYFIHIPDEKGAIYGGGIHTRVVTGYVPYIYGTGGYKFGIGQNASTILTGRVAYGGMGDFQLGISNRWDFDLVYFDISMNSMLGFFSPENLPGGALALSLGFRY